MLRLNCEPKSPRAPLPMLVDQLKVQIDGSRHDDTAGTALRMAPARKLLYPCRRDGVEPPVRSDIIGALKDLGMITWLKISKNAHLPFEKVRLRKDRDETPIRGRARMIGGHRSRWQGSERHGSSDGRRRARRGQRHRSGRAAHNL